MSKIVRREFLGSWVLFLVLCLAGSLASTGCPDRSSGASDLKSVAAENIVALCDVDWKHAGATFEKFPGADPTLGISMKSVGEVMAIGRTFKEALQKGIRSLEIGRFGLGSDGKELMLPEAIKTPEEREEALEEVAAAPTPPKAHLSFA